MSVPQFNDNPFIEPKKKSALIVDPPLTVSAPRGTIDQNWAVVSFISPEDRIKQRFFYSANKFLYYNVNKQLIDSTTQIARDSNTKIKDFFAKKIEHYKSSTDNPVYGLVAEVLSQLQEQSLEVLNEDAMVSSTLRQYRINSEELISQFDQYKTVNEKDLTEEFNAEFDEGTSIRGLKIRGIYDDLQDAKKRGKYCRDNIEQAINTYVVPVGKWCPWDPTPDSVLEQDYMVEELNEMMTKYNENVAQKNEFFDKHKKDMIESNAEEREKAIRSQLKEQLRAKREALKSERTRK